MYEVPFRLRFFVLGAQKCATSWLYYCLRDHPEVVLPVSKIEHGYIGGATFRKRGPDWYYGRFPLAPVGAVRGEVAVDYLLDGNVPEVLGAYADDPRFVVLMRDPVSRLVSAYYWSMRRDQLPNVPIETGISRLLDQAAGFPDRFENRYFDELVSRGFYGEQLAAYLRVFEPDRFLVVSYSEIKTDPARVMRRIYAHIGVDPRFMPPRLGVKPKRNSYSRWALSLERLSNGRTLGAVADRLNRLVSSFKPGEPGLSRASRMRLTALFEPRVACTERVLDLLPPNNRPKPELIRAWRPGPAKHAS